LYSSKLSLEFISLIAIQHHQSVHEKTARAFKVRHARRTDSERIVSLLQELGYPNGTSSTTIHWVLSHPEMDVFVATDGNDRAIGLLTLSHRPQLRANGRIVTIDELVVSELWRRQGVARELLRQAVDRARTLTANRVEIVSRGARREAPAFFQACGLSQADAGVFRVTKIDFESK
jgi:N-acetylglutamate synthase-like GNAT family acetyltransferase